MATAMTLDAFWPPSNAKALSMNPMNKLPPSPREMVAGSKFERRKCRGMAVRG